MRVFVAGGSGVIGRRLVPLLLADGHEVVATTRSLDRAAALRSQGAHAVIMDAYDADTLLDAVTQARPDVVIHQLTDLAGGFSESSLRANTRLRDVGTRNLVAASLAVGARRLVAQSAAWLYAPGEGDRIESDPLRDPADDPDDLVLPGVLSLEQQVLDAPAIEGVVLRYGLLYGQGTGAEGPHAQPSLHVDAAARAAALTVTHGAAGVYNVVDDGGGVSNARARAELGWAP